MMSPFEDKNTVPLLVFSRRNLIDIFYLKSRPLFNYINLIITLQIIQTLQC
jgi:hypothetical protein